MVGGVSVWRWFASVSFSSCPCSSVSYIVPKDRNVTVYGGEAGSPNTLDSLSSEYRSRECLPVSPNAVIEQCELTTSLVLADGAIVHYVFMDDDVVCKSSQIDSNAWSINNILADLR